MYQARPIEIKKRKISLTPFHNVYDKKNSIKIKQIVQRCQLK